MKVQSNYFYGNKISDYGIREGYVDYRTLARSFDAVLNNDIISNTYNVGYWDIISSYNSDEINELRDRIYELETQDETSDELDELYGQLDELENTTPEIFQYYIVSDNAVSILEEAGEIVFYNAALNMYVWGVTHYGTAWDYVLTNIKIDF